MDPITAGITLVREIANKFWPDKTQEEKDSIAAQMQMMLIQSDMFKSAAGIVQAEVASKSWLAASWRPILMLVFGALIVARFFGYTAPDISPQEYVELWSLLKLGIGGYVIGRSVEKVTPTIANAIKGKS